MKVQIREHIKKWWILVVVATLALSLTSCGKKRSRLMSGELPCEGELGSFALSTLPYGRGTVQLIVYVDYLDYDTDLTLTLFDSQTGSNEFLTNVRTVEGAKLVYNIPESYVYDFDELRITPTDNSRPWSSQSPTIFADCELPLPGQSGSSY